MKFREYLRISLLVLLCISSVVSIAAEGGRTVQTASALTNYYESLENTAEKKAEEAEQERRDAAVRTANNIYLSLLLLFTVGLMAFLIRKSRKGEIVQGNQKFGIALIISSGLVILLSVIISEGWVYQFDFLQNVISTLRIRLFEGERTYNYRQTYLIDIPTKYVIFVFISAAAYGLTTFIGITPYPKRKVDKN